MITKIKEYLINSVKKSINVNPKKFLMDWHDNMHYLL